MHYMILPLKRYLDFKGRSRRKEYWMFFLFVTVALVALMILDTMLGLGGTATTRSEFGGGAASASVDLTGGTLTMIFALLMFVPGLAVAIRRIHDQDKTGWLVLVPFYNLILMFLEGTSGPNRYGPDPKGAAAEAEQFA